MVNNLAEQNLKISVIVPLYNVEKYVSACVESVLNQTYKNTEIILVDDGATDRSSEICDHYAANFSNVKVLHKKNGGLSDARNKGVEHATGDYVLFLDGDDFWDEPEALSVLVNRLQISKADVLNFSFKKYYEDTGEKILYFEKLPEMPLDADTKEKQLMYLSENHLYISSACTKLIKRPILNTDLLFEQGVYSEDVEWSARLLKKAQSMDFICANFYCYRQRRDSISHTINDQKCNDLCKHIINCISLYEEATEQEKDALANYAAYQYGTYFIVQAQAESPQDVCISRLKTYSWILKHHKGNKKLFLLNAGCSILGYQTMCKMIRLIYRFRKKQFWRRPWYR